MGLLSRTRILKTTPPLRAAVLGFIVLFLAPCVRANVIYIIHNHHIVKTEHSHKHIHPIISLPNSTTWDCTPIAAMTILEHFGIDYSSGEVLDWFAAYLGNPDLNWYVSGVPDNQYAAAMEAFLASYGIGCTECDEWNNSDPTGQMIADIFSGGCGSISTFAIEYASGSLHEVTAQVSYSDPDLLIISNADGNGQVVEMRRDDFLGNTIGTSAGHLYPNIPVLININK